MGLNGPLMSRIGAIIGDFISSLLHYSCLSDYTLLVIQLGVCDRGLRILYPSQHTNHNFVIVMCTAIHYTRGGF